MVHIMVAHTRIKYNINLLIIIHDTTSKEARIFNMREEFGEDMLTYTITI